MAKWNKVTFIWVPGYKGIPGNDKASSLVKEMTGKYPTFLWNLRKSGVLHVESMDGCVAH
jgi:hypothetical protein